MPALPLALLLLAAPVTDAAAPVTDAAAPVTTTADVVAPPITAATEPTRATGDVATVSDAARLDAMQAVLDARRSYANTWVYGWTTAYAVGTVAQGVLYFVVPEDDRPGYLVGTATAALAVGGMLISPVKAGGVADRFRALRADGRDDDAEDLFTETADGEREARNLFNHALSAAVGLGSGAVLLFHYDQPGAALFQTVSSLVIGEIQIWTGPTDAADARDKWLEDVAVAAGPDRLVVSYRFR